MPLHAHSLAGMYGDVLRAGRETGRLARAKALVTGLRRRVGEITARARRARRRPRVFCMEWIDPVFTTGHWVPELVERAGGREGLARVGRPSRRIAWKEVLAYAPERLVVMPCGIGLADAVRQARTLTRRAGWDGLPAVRSCQVYIADGPSYFNGAGPRLVQGLEILSEIIHSNLFPTKHLGSSYLPLNY